jgi:glycosyltransferase involved in cell wall biosynthesis
MHGSEMKQFYESQPTFLRYIIQKTLENSDRVLVLSNSWKQFVSVIAPKSNITVLENYVNVPPADDRHFSESPSIVFLGLVGPRKGTFDLISAFSDVLKYHPNAKLYIGGNGDISAARELIEKLDLSSSVELLGWIDPVKRDELLKTTWVYTLPSYNEGLPMSVLEAMSYGIPVVTTDVGGIPELIEHGINGFMVTPGHIQGLATSLISLLNNTEYNIKIGECGRRTILSRFSREIILERLIEVYKVHSLEKS